MGDERDHGAASSRGAVGRPGRDEAAAYYAGYIDRIAGDDIVGTLERQSQEMLAFLRGISEEASLRRYAPEKWSVRQVLNHVSDTERLFVFRAFWFARGFDSPLPSFDQNVSSAAARADDIPWSKNVEEFDDVRRSTLDLFRNLPKDAWMRRGIASDNPFTVRALAYIAAGHLSHHVAILREKYL